MENGTIYTNYTINIGKTIFNVLVVTGKSNYINICRSSNNVFRSLGKQFNNFDEAVKNYSNPTMKLELLKIELGLN